MAADTSTTVLAICKESSFGLLAALAAFTDLRYTGESITHSKATIKSNEITRNRQVKDLIKVGASAQGDVNFELGLLCHRTLLLATLGQASWTSYTHTGTASIDVGTGILEFSANMASGLKGCGYVLVSGFTNPANNGVKRILSHSDGSDTIEFALGEFEANETLVAGVTVSRTTAYNGTHQDSFTLERAVLKDDGNYAYQNYKGMTVAGMSLKIGSMEHVTGAFSFLGKKGEPLDRSLARAGESAATGTLTLTGTPVADTTITIGVGTGQKVYTWKASVTTGANQVKIGADASASLDNLIAAINGGTGSGSLYGSSTTAHTQVTAAAGVGDTMVLTAILTNATGAFGNTIVTTETMGNGSFGSATLTGGVSADAHTAPSSETAVNGTNNLVAITAGESVLSDPAKTLSISINNNLRSKDKLSQEGAFEIGQGQFDVSGTLEVYFENNDLWTQIVDHKAIALSVLFQDSDGNLMGITFPRVMLADGNPNAPQNNADVMMTINFTAIKDPTTGITMQVDSFVA